MLALRASLFMALRKVHSARQHLLPSLGGAWASKHDRGHVCQMRSPMRVSWLPLPATFADVAPSSEEDMRGLALGHSLLRSLEILAQLPADSDALRNASALNLPSGSRFRRPTAAAAAAAAGPGSCWPR